MFHIRNVVTITEYLLLSVLTLSTGCLAAEKDYDYYFTTRRPLWESYITTKRYFLEDYTDSPSFKDIPPGHNDIVIFIIVLFGGIIVTSLLSYFAFCHPNSSSTSSSSSTSNVIRRPVAGAVIHPPPSGPLTSPNVPTAPPGSLNYPLTTFTNAGYQSDSTVVTDGRPGDVPPDYAAVALGDLTATNKIFPTVMKMETPPPQYQTDGKPFSLFKSILRSV